MNRFEQLASHSNLMFGILGNPALDSFDVLEVTSGSLAEITRRENFVGLVGCSGIRFHCALAVELDDASISALTQVFTNLVERAITRLESPHKYRRHDWSELT
jgi:hypothetical protein